MKSSKRRLLCFLLLLLCNGVLMYSIHTEDVADIRKDAHSDSSGGSGGGIKRADDIRVGVHVVKRSASGNVNVDDAKDVSDDVNGDIPGDAIKRKAYEYNVDVNNNEDDDGDDDGDTISDARAGVIKRSTHVGHAANSTGTDNATEHDDHHAEKHSGQHVSIHVASWNFDHVKTPFITSVFLIAAGIAKLGFHHANFLSSKVPESCLLIILGLGVGAILYGVLPTNDSMPGLTSDLFFLYLLPPIILESAYSLHDRCFYENVGTVLLYAGIGTILNCFLIGPTLYGIYKAGGMGSDFAEMQFIQCLVFSAIVVAVDPVAVLAIFQEIGVNNTLYFLVFGESLLNDAVTVVLYNMMKTFNLMDEITIDQVVLGIVQFFVVSFGGLGIGLLYGVLTAIITKYTEHCRVVEPLAVFVLAYLSYLMAEMFHFSGIISIIGCGLVQAQYAFQNISRKSHTTVKYFSKMMSATNDCIIFLFLGVAVFREDVLNLDYWHPWFILWAIVLCLLYRFLVVFVLTFFLNRMNRMKKIEMEEQFIMAYGGLRGAVAFSLVDVLSQENLPKGHFLNTTLMVIFFTVFIQGGTIKPLVKFLRVRMEETKKLQISEEINIHVTDHVMAGVEEIIGQRGEHYVREVLEYYNSHYLKRWLQRDPISTDEQIMQYYEKLALEQHFENLAGSKMIQEKYGSRQELLGDLDISLPDDSSSDEFNEYEEAEMSREPSDAGSFVLPVPTSLHSSTSDIGSELDAELLSNQMGMRRKSLFPVAMTKDLENRLADNPTAEDIRKIMVPSRRQRNYRRLDKNITSDDSENDLLRFLQNKKLRNRRISHAVYHQPSMDGRETPSGRDTPMGRETPSGGRRRSLAPDLTANYRRRLSVVAPGMTPPPPRKRGESVGFVMRGIDSPARRRLKMKRRTVSEALDSGEKSPTMLKPLTEIGEESVGFHIESDDDGHAPLDIIEETSNEKSPSTSSGAVTDTTPDSVASPESMTQPTTKKPKGILTRQSRSEDQHPRSPRSPKSPSSGDGVRTPERVFKFVPPRESPSAVRKQKFKKATSKSFDEAGVGPAPRVRKNLSYMKAVSFDETAEQAYESDEENDEK